VDACSDRDDPKLVQQRQARGGPQTVAVTRDNAVGGEPLDGSDSLEAEQPLKRVQLALASGHEPNDGALSLYVGVLEHRS
jgi:hypothetical protein